MQLGSCVACRRHIAESEVSCPFCGSPHTPERRALLVRPGRFSRAAIFAGLAACYTSTQPQVSSPPSPPPPPVGDQGSGQWSESPPQVSGAVLHGRLKHAKTGAPLVGVTVEVWTSASVPTTAVTNAKGEYVVRGLEVREYQVSFMGPDGVRYATAPIVELHSESETFDLAFEPVPQPIPKPYGAPPARRRTV